MCYISSNVYCVVEIRIIFFFKIKVKKVSINGGLIKIFLVLKIEKNKKCFFVLILICEGFSLWSFSFNFGN